ncbi:DNA-methyltransferase [Neorhodopirellula lusitana]|uniref:DNA-methyltransferase n=1 Tax=Neorhodopirellula lusitana TaxID=445327 RepID=UPI00384E3856
MSIAKSKNQVHQGDCVKLLGEVEEGSVDLVFADPPFNIGYDYDVYDDTQQSDDYLKWCRQWIDGVYRALKPDGTFWLAIGDEYAAELKIEAQKAGFQCRSWVIWYYTFGVNCVNGFSRSHTHLFHFVKNPKKFTFNRPNPQIRVKSARQLVYADNRANPNGRLPDNTWILRPQDAPTSFSPSHDTWYFARVAGTFKEREGFHGCQMPEQLLARIIRSSSSPQDLVLDPFGGSGTTMSVAKKLGRQWMGFELSEDYATYINERLAKTHVGDPIDGAEDPIQSSPSTKQGKRRPKPFSEETEKAVIAAYEKAGSGYPAEYIMCDMDLNKEFIAECRERGVTGSAFIWNRYLFHLRKQGKLTKSTQQPPRIGSAEINRYGYASEVAWRLLAIDYQKTLDDILCSPEFASEFDRLAALYGPTDVTPIEYRRAALSIRKRTKPARELAVEKFSKWMKKKIRPIAIDDFQNAEFEVPGVFVLCHEEASIFAGESENMREQIALMMDNPSWQELEPDSILHIKNNDNFATRFALKAALVQRELPALNCRLWASDSELPV